MKNIYLITILFIAVLFSACEKRLDPKIDGEINEDEFWANNNYVEGILLNAYRNIPQYIDNYGNNFLDAATDNAITNNYGSNVHRLVTGKISVNDNPITNWDKAYIQLRNINLFFERGLDTSIVYILSDSAEDVRYRNRLKAEAYFLRAWWGFELLKLAGGKDNNGQALGYVIVNKTLDPDQVNEVNKMPRNTYEECVVQILKDLDSALAVDDNSFPDKYSGNDQVTGIAGLGRASKEAAWGLKSKVTLYGASPAYQPDGISQADVQAKWLRAARSAQEAIDGIGNFSKLSTGDFNKSATPGEFIFRRYANNKSLEQRNYPPRFNGKGYTCPSQNLVDAFPASNGFPITDTARSNYDPQDPYSNRDSRLALNIFVNDDVFNGGADSLEIYEGGRDAPGSSPYATRTGYYLRKWLATTTNMLSPNVNANAHHYHALLRKTEVYLNFAEAANEAWGPMTNSDGGQTAEEILNSIRSTSGGITDNTYTNEVATLGKDAFRELIQNERRIELAFENHRYFDLRRWKLDDLINEDIYGIKMVRYPIEVYAGTDSAYVRDSIYYDYGTGGKGYIVEERNFSLPRDYYLPIPYDEVVKNPNLDNNIGW